jgi:UDP-glucose 4-epimerase
VKAIVTGGAGFVGSHLARRLLGDGWEVAVVDNLSSGFERNVPDGAELIRADLTEEESAAALPGDGVDAIFHLASHVGQELSFEKPLYDFKANGLATMILLDHARRHDIPRFVFASSMNVYGFAEENPVSEATPAIPRSPYAVGKLASEHLCGVYHGLGTSTSALRLFNVYGPGQDMQNMKQGMASIFMTYVARGEPVEVRGSKDRFRDFIYVDDVVDAFVRCLDDAAQGNVYNVSTGRKTHVWELIDGIVQAFGHDPADYPIEYQEGTLRDQFGVYGDSSRFARDTGWAPRTELNDGLAAMARWVREEGNL